MTKKIPDTSEAEKWLTDTTFIFQGKVYQVLPNGKVIRKGRLTKKVFQKKNL